MATIKWARATQSNKANTYLGANGELVIDMEQNRIFLYDGANAYVSNTFFSANVFIAPAGAVFDWSVGPTESILYASDAQADDYFGQSVSINSDGTYAIVGAFGEDGGAGNPINQSGAAYIFTRSGSTWTQQTILRAADRQAGDNFGFSVSIGSDGDYAIVGAYSEDGGSGNPAADSGAAYIFTRSGSTWSQQAILRASDRQASDQFGYSVSMSSDGSYAIIGTPGEDTNGSAAGAAYIFTRSGSTWTQQAKIQSSDIQATDSFGWSVSINSDGDYAIIGASYDTTVAATYAGSAYIFTRSGSTWTQQAKLTASDAQGDDYFGYSVSINGDGDYAIVGANGEDTGGSSAGAAYIFTRSGSTWTQQQKIQSSDIQANDNFGISVSMSSDGDYAVVGAYGENGGPGDPINAAGAAYVFSRSGSTWTEQAILRASDAQSVDRLGQTVSISGDGAYAITGAPYEDGGAGNPISYAGAAYIYEA